MKKYRIRGKCITSEVIKMFEENSWNVSCIRKIAKLIINLIIICCLYCLISEILKRLVIVHSIFLISLVVIITEYTMIKSNNILYEKCKEAGGKKCNFHLIRKYNDILTTNKKIMLNQEINLLKKILKENNMYNVKCMEEIRNYLENNKSKEKIDENDFAQGIVGVFVLPIVFEIISTYISINKSSIELTIVGIGYIGIGAAIVSVMLYVAYIIKKIKKLSDTKVYTYSRLIIILTDLILIESKTRYSR